MSRSYTRSVRAEADSPEAVVISREMRGAARLRPRGSIGGRGPRGLRRSFLPFLHSTLIALLAAVFSWTGSSLLYSEGSPAADPGWIDALVETVHADFLAAASGADSANAAVSGADAKSPERSEAAAPPAAPYTFNSLFAAAIAGNRELAALLIDSRKADIQRKRAAAARFPTIDFQTSLSWLANPLGKISVTAGEFGSISVGGEEILIPPRDMVIYEGMEDTYYQFKTTLTQPVFTWGKIRTAAELAKLGRTGAELQLEKKRREIRTQIRIYLSVLAYTAKIERILGYQQEASQRLLRLAEDSYENGFIIYTDLLDARIRTKEIEIAVVQLQEQREQTLLKLARLCGLPSLRMTELDLSGFAVLPDGAASGTGGTASGETSGLGPLPDRSALMERVRAENSDIRLLGLLTEVQRLKGVIAAAGGYLKPDVGIRVELSYGGSRFPLVETDWYGQDDYSLTVSLAFQGSVWDGGIKGAEIAESLEDLDSAPLQYAEGTAALEQFVAETCLSLELAERKMEYQRLRIENDSQQIELKRTQYRAGSAPELDYISAELLFYTDVIELYRLEIDYITTYQTLRNVAGLDDAEGIPLEAAE